MNRVPKENAMHGSTRSRVAVHPAATGTRAVVWIEPGRALVVLGGDGDEVASHEVAIPDLAAAMPPALAAVAHSIGTADRILVMGEEDLRTALEREIVAIGHRPEIIREADAAGPIDEEALVARHRRLV